VVKLDTLQIKRVTEAVDLMVKAHQSLETTQRIQLELDALIETFSDAQKMAYEAHKLIVAPDTVK